ncbi:MAG: methyltransferase domain-containing protein [Oscillospiraceae bacterium]
MNEEKFTGKAALYEMSRPSYAQGAIDLIRSEIPLGEKVADIGAGTGKFTRQLLSAGYKVYAVEPNADMRERLLDCGAEVVCAPAEETGLPDNSVALVTAAQAFHWFDREKFRAECRRILVPGGKVLLLWNSEDGTSQIIKDIDALCRRYYLKDEPRRKSDDDTGVFFAEHSVFNFRNDLVMDREHFIANRMSRSHAPRVTDKNYGEFENALSELFDKYSHDGTVTIPNITRGYFGTV